MTVRFWWNAATRYFYASSLKNMHVIWTIWWEFQFAKMALRC